MPLTPQSRIQSFVEEEDHYFQDIRSSLHRAIKLGLELGREAGPGMKEEKTSDIIKEPNACQHRPRLNGICNGCKIHNEALTAKNQAITDLIESIG